MLLRVREFRQKAGLSQLALAQESCCSRELISAIETARSQSTLAQLSKIAQALHVPVWSLFPEDPPAGPHAP
jgi:transcriptional regulator with XRE-family HTH domain